MADAPNAHRKDTSRSARRWSRRAVAMSVALFGVAGLAGTAAATLPIGNQLRVSTTGTDGDTNFRAEDVEVAYNARDDQYLVVWEADTATSDEQEVFGRIHRADGTPVGGQFRISDMGPDGDAAFDAEDPKVTYNRRTNEFLVVWHGDDNTAPLVDNEQEIFGQRITAAGAEIGPNDFRISETGPPADTAFEAFDPDVAYNARTTSTW